eukprot:g11096.t1
MISFSVQEFSVEQCCPVRSALHSRHPLLRGAKTPGQGVQVGVILEFTCSVTKKGKKKCCCDRKMVGGGDVVQTDRFNFQSELHRLNESEMRWSEGHLGPKPMTFVARGNTKIHLKAYDEERKTKRATAFGGAAALGEARPHQEFAVVAAFEGDADTKIIGQQSQSCFTLNVSEVVPVGHVESDNTKLKGPRNVLVYAVYDTETGTVAYRYPDHEDVCDETITRRSRGRSTVLKEHEDQDENHVEPEQEDAAKKKNIKKTSPGGPGLTGITFRIRLARVASTDQISLARCRPRELFAGPGRLLEDRTEWQFGSHVYTNQWPNAADNLPMEMLQHEHEVLHMIEREFKMDSVALYATLFPQNLTLACTSSEARRVRGCPLLYKELAWSAQPTMLSAGKKASLAARGALHLMRVMFWKRLHLLCAYAGVFLLPGGGVEAGSNSRAKPWPYPMAALWCHGGRDEYRTPSVAQLQAATPLKKRLAATHGIGLKSRQQAEVAELVEKKLHATNLKQTVGNLADGVMGRHFGLNFAWCGLGSPLPYGPPSGMPRPRGCGLEALLRKLAVDYPRLVMAESVASTGASGPPAGAEVHPNREPEAQHADASAQEGTRGDALERFLEAEIDGESLSHLLDRAAARGYSPHSLLEGLRLDAYHLDRLLGALKTFFAQRDELEREGGESLDVVPVSLLRSLQFLGFAPTSAAEIRDTHIPQLDGFLRLRLHILSKMAGIQKFVGVRGQAVRYDLSAHSHQHKHNHDLQHQHHVGEHPHLHGHHQHQDHHPHRVASAAHFAKEKAVVFGHLYLRVDEFALAPAGGGPKVNATSEAALAPSGVKIEAGAAAAAEAVVAPSAGAAPPRESAGEKSVFNLHRTQRGSEDELAQVRRSDGGGTFVEDDQKLARSDVAEKHPFRKPKIGVLALLHEEQDVVIEKHHLEDHRTAPSARTTGTGRGLLGNQRGTGSAVGRMLHKVVTFGAAGGEQSSTSRASDAAEPGRIRNSNPANVPETSTSRPSAAETVGGGPRPPAPTEQKSQIQVTPPQPQPSAGTGRGWTRLREMGTAAIRDKGAAVTKSVTGKPLITPSGEKIRTKIITEKLQQEFRRRVVAVPAEAKTMRALRVASVGPEKARYCVGFSFVERAWLNRFYEMDDAKFLQSPGVVGGEVADEAGGAEAIIPPPPSFRVLQFLLSGWRRSDAKVFSKGAYAGSVGGRHCMSELLRHASGIEADRHLFAELRQGRAALATGHRGTPTTPSANRFISRDVCRVWVAANYDRALWWRSPSEARASGKNLISFLGVERKGVKSEQSSQNPSLLSLPEGGRPQASLPSAGPPDLGALSFKIRGGCLTEDALGGMVRERFRAFFLCCLQREVHEMFDDVLVRLGLAMKEHEGAPPTQTTFCEAVRTALDALPDMQLHGMTELLTGGRDRGGAGAAECKSCTFSGTFRELRVIAETDEHVGGSGGGRIRNRSRQLLAVYEIAPPQISHVFVARQIGRSALAEVLSGLKLKLDEQTVYRSFLQRYVLNAGDAATRERKKDAPSASDLASTTRNFFAKSTGTAGGTSINRVTPDHFALATTAKRPSLAENASFLDECCAWSDCANKAASPRDVQVSVDEDAALIPLAPSDIAAAVDDQLVVVPSIFHLAVQKYSERYRGGAPVLDCARAGEQRVHWKCEQLPASTPARGARWLRNVFARASTPLRGGPPPASTAAVGSTTSLRLRRANARADVQLASVAEEWVLALSDDEADDEARECVAQDREEVLTGTMSQQLPAAALLAPAREAFADRENLWRTFTRVWRNVLSWTETHHTVLLLPPDAETFFVLLQLFASLSNGGSLPAGAACSPAQAGPGAAAPDDDKQTQEGAARQVDFVQEMRKLGGLLGSGFASLRELNPSPENWDAICQRGRESFAQLLLQRESASPENGSSEASPSVDTVIETYNAIRRGALRFFLPSTPFQDTGRVDGQAEEATGVGPRLRDRTRKILDKVILDKLSFLRSESAAADERGDPASSKDLVRGKDNCKLDEVVSSNKLPVLLEVVLYLEVTSGRPGASSGRCSGDSLPEVLTHAETGELLSTTVSLKESFGEAAARLLHEKFGMAPSAGLITPVGGAAFPAGGQPDLVSSVTSTVTLLEAEAAGAATAVPLQVVKKTVSYLARYSLDSSSLTTSLLRAGLHFRSSRSCRAGSSEGPGTMLFSASGTEQLLAGVARANLQYGAGFRHQRALGRQHRERGKETLWAHVEAGDRVARNKMVLRKSVALAGSKLHLSAPEAAELVLEGDENMATFRGLVAKAGSQKMLESFPPVDLPATYSYKAPPAAPAAASHAHQFESALHAADPCAPANDLRFEWRLASDVAYPNEDLCSKKNATTAPAHFLGSLLLGIEGTGPGKQSPFAGIDHGTSGKANFTSARGSRKWSAFEANLVTGLQETRTPMPAGMNGMRAVVSNKTFEQFVHFCDKVVDARLEKTFWWDQLPQAYFHHGQHHQHNMRSGQEMNPHENYGLQPQLLSAFMDGITSGRGGPRVLRDLRAHQKRLFKEILCADATRAKAIVQALDRGTAAGDTICGWGRSFGRSRSH